MSFLRKIKQLFQPLPVETTPAASNEAQPASLNQLFQEQLLAAIQQSFPALEVAWHEEYLRLKPTGLMLATEVLGQTRHPNAFTCTLGVRVFHQAYFPDGIADFLAGIGEDELTAVTNGASNYVEGMLPTILEGISAQHDPALDILAPSGEPIWHPLMGLLQVQGAWSAHSADLEDTHFFELLRPALLAHLSPEPFHWLKVYISRQPAGEIISECLLDNQPWPEGLALLQAEASAWPRSGQFAGQKQFMLFRKCGLA
ncbi:hypothetical protein GCM10027422_15870 [Hymenobacter arcticus]